MSHYACAVFANNPNDFDRLIEPYSECNEKYYKRIPADQQKLIEEYEQLKPQNHWEQLDDFLSAMHYKREGDEIVSYYNPDGKYDWYTIDGRDWMFEFKPGHGYDEYGNYKKSDVEFDEPNLEDREIAEKFWDGYVLKQDLDAYSDAFFTQEYYLDRYGTKEQYLKECAKTVPYAFVKPDGTWVAPGRVGWFACDDSTSASWNRYVEAWDEFVNNAPDCYMTVADMHI